MPGELEPEAFWMPAVGDRFSIRPWEMNRVRIEHYDQMLRYMREVPSFG